MITIFKNKGDIPQGMECVELNDIFFNQNTAGRMDDKACGIIETIDGAKLVGKYKIASRFDGSVLDIDKLSSGCKTVLNVMYNPKKAFSLKECGENALGVLFGLDTGNVYSDYARIPFEMGAVCVHTSMGKRIISDYEELKEWWES